MYWMQNQSRYENMAYAALWGLLFAAPVISLYMRMTGNSELEFQWKEVFFIWQQFAVFLLLFLIHNFLLAPLLIYRHKRMLYATLLTAMVACFVLYQCNTRPDGLLRHGPRHMAQHGVKHGNPMEHGMEGAFDPAERPDFAEGAAPDFAEGAAPDFGPGDRPDPDEGGVPGEPPHEQGAGHERDKKHTPPPAFFGQHDLIATIILFLMLGMNLGVKLYFKTRKDQKKMAELEKENLEQQLQYLKYQINPHFFMNTLNNIHALVDIDPAKAQQTILELSKMMRFILYEGDKQGVPLSREFDFIRNYVTLMSLRYTDKVSITVDLPPDVPDATVPPLMLISFIENAFKHGISYQHPSFVDIRVAIEDGRLHFHCSNSKADKPNEEKGGVGLANVKQRLNLLYDNNYTLNIKDEADAYNVELDIPLK